MSEQHPVRLTVAERGTRLIVSWSAPLPDWWRIKVAFRDWFKGHDMATFRSAGRCYSLPKHDRSRARLMDWIDTHLQDAEVSWPEQEARMREAAVLEGVG